MWCIIFPVTTLIEPEVSTELEVDKAKPERIININNTMTSRGRTFDVDLPVITMKYGPFRSVYSLKSQEVKCIYLPLFAVTFTSL